jgi:predicted DCC family thiol-disulfide oxidoreductase YuxK
MAGSDTVLYDGECKFCTRSVAMLRRLDVTGRLQFMSLHDPQVAALYPSLTFDMLMREMWVVSAGGEKYGGADAIRYLSRHMPLLLPLAPLLHLPFTRRIQRAAYRAIANRRYAISGGDCGGGTCSLHGAKVDA